MLSALAASLGQTWALPNRCTSCRRAVRRARFAAVDDGMDESIMCVECHGPFWFSQKDKQFYAAQGYQRPRRCRACRRAQSSEPARPGAKGSSDASHAAEGASARLPQAFRRP
jgi:putative zinc ribbon protein